MKYGIKRNFFTSQMPGMNSVDKFADVLSASTSAGQYAIAPVRNGFHVDIQLPSGKLDTEFHALRDIPAC